ncbi:MAG: ankyrin repeat domain-containing protein [Sedimentisphaerales bacterium]|nr:ankyrin repeat domain-containing protein [Sedimentisphaerales bacterium]
MDHKRLLSLTTYWILVIVPGLCVISFADNKSQTNPEAEQHFEKANELHILADYDAAIAEYQTVISLSPNSKIAQNAQYWIGQLYFESKRFDAALSAFQKLLDAYPESRTIPATTLMIERVQQAKKNKSLFEAVKKADVEKVKLLIAAGADVDAKWGDICTKEEEEKAKTFEVSSTPLYYACDSNSITSVQLLVKEGADVNAGKWPPLCQALYRRNTAIAKFLIDHGANVNYPADWGPLHEASVYDIDMVKVLLAKGANINGGYCPPLHTAVMKGPKDIVELLIQQGADINAKDKWGCTPLYWSINNKVFPSDNDNPPIDSLHLLIANGADVNIEYGDGETALLLAAKAGQTDTVRLLLEAGANINAKDDRGQNALHVMLDIRNASNNRYRLSKDTLELLLAKGADVNAKDNDGRTPLHLAAESADREIVALLLDKGADINAKEDKSGFTALHYAARLGKRNIAELLIARGADIHANDKQGHTPLYVAANHDYEVAELLINKGADGSIQTESGQTLLQLAQERKQIESMVPDMVFDGEADSVLGNQIACGDVDGDGYDDILIRSYQNNGYRGRGGRVYLFYGGANLATTADLIFEGEKEEDRFGDGIACGDVDNDGYEDIVIAAGGYSENQGCAYLYWGGDRKSMDANPDKIFVGEQEKDAQFGTGHPAVYDIDNDGYGDIVLGACSSRARTGRAYLYYGDTRESMDTTHDLIFTAQDGGERFFGYTISCGDVDNNGYGDILIGGFAKQGRAFLYCGERRSSMDAKAEVIFEVKSEDNDYFGRDIVCIDQNRDGYDDIAIGARGHKDKQIRTYLFHGSSKGSLDADPDMIIDGEMGGSDYGIQEVCGDIDGDNLNDLVIAASGVGRVYVYWGKDLSALNPEPGRIFTGEHPHDQFGGELACGDVNNDGFDDLVIGAHGYKAGAKQGRVYLYYGGPRNQ